MPIANSKRSLNLIETTPPSGDNSSFSVSTILFSPDGSKLVADVKGIINENTPGFLAVWDVNADGSLSRTPMKFSASPKRGQQNFGMIHLNGKEGYVMADGSQGGLVYDFSKGYNKNFVVKNIVTDGQIISCWTQFLSKSNTYFFTDPLTGRLSEYAIDIDSLNTTLVAQHQLPSSVVVIDSAIANIGKNQ